MSWRRDFAQMNVLEAIFAVSIVLLAIVYVNTYKAPPTTPSITIPSNQLKVLGDELLQRLDDSNCWYHDCLTDFIMINETNNWMYFDGEDDYINLSDNPVDEIVDSSYTVEAWVLLGDNLTGSGSKYCVLGGDLNGFDFCFENVSGTVYLNLTHKFSDGSINYVSYSGERFVRYVWYYVAGVFDQSAKVMKLYVNGSLKNSVSVASSCYYPIKYIGCYDDGSGLGSFFYGSLENVRIYNRVLSDNDIYDSYRNHTASYGLVAWWGFNSGKGSTVYDDAGCGNYGVIHGASWTEDGKYGDALNFDGVTDYIDCGNDESLQVSDFTVNMWLNPSAFTETRRGIIQKTDYKHEFAINLHSDGAVDFYWGDGTNHVGGWDFLPPSSIQFSNWQMLTLQREGSVCRGYVNGQLVKEKSFTISPAVGTGSLTIGKTYAGYFKGVIDDVRVYNRALSDDEIEDLYGGYQVKSGLVGCWHFDEGSGDYVRDSSTSCKSNGVINGASWAPYSFSDFLNYVNGSLPSNVYYHVWLYNISSGRPEPYESRGLLYPSERLVTTNNVVKCHHCIVFGKYVYVVELEMWYV